MKGIRRKELDIVLASFATECCADVKDLFLRSGYSITELLADTQFDFANKDRVLVLHLDLKNASKEAAIHLLSRKPPEVPCFGIIHSDGIELDAQILSHCSEFVVWPCDQEEIFFRLHSMLASKLSLDAAQVNHSVGAGDHMVGNSDAFMHVLKRIKLFSKCDAPVLIEGETGTGKEMIARAIHYYSERRDYPFIPVNCGALPDNLIENELFGHEKGAYTDAKSNSKGLVGQAYGGTLFLDEVESLSPKGQVALLRLLQEQEYKPLGSDKPIKANVRIVTASNLNLKLLSQKDIIRQDLFYRLNILSVVIPPLRERGDDAQLLVDHFLNKYRKQYNEANKQLHEAVVTWMRQYAWPGNVRELENMTHRAFLISEGDLIYTHHFCDGLVDGAASSASHRIEYSPYYDVSFNDAKSLVIEAFEKQYLSHLMQRSNGNVTLAAKKACKERRAFGKLLKKHGIDRIQYTQPQ